MFFRLFCIVFEAILQYEGVVVHSSRSLYELTCVGVFFRLFCITGVCGPFLLLDLCLG